MFDCMRKATQVGYFFILDGMIYHSVIVVTTLMINIYTTNHKLKLEPGSVITPQYNKYNM